MELSSLYLPTELPWSSISVTVLCIYIAYFVVRIGFFHPNDEAPVRYEVPLPEQAKAGWSGKILEKPAIKVLRESIFHYCLDLIHSRSQDQASSNAITLLPDSCWATSTQQPQMASIGHLLELLKHSKNGPRQLLHRGERF